MTLKHAGLSGAFALAAMTALSSGALAQDPIKIGVIAPFDTPPGEGLINAAEMAAEDINAEGGIDGREVELIIRNDEYEADVGVSAYQRLALRDEVDVVIGTASSGVSMAITDHMARYKVPFISTGAASLQLSEKVADDYDRYKYWFRVMHTTNNIADSVGDWAVNFLNGELGLNKAAILAENALWTDGLLPRIKGHLDEADIEVVAEEYFDLDTRDYRPIISRIEDAGAEFILDFSSHVDGSTYVRQWGQLEGPIMGGLNASGTSSRFWEDTEGGALGHADLIQGGYRVDLTPNTVEWFDRYVDAYEVSPDYTTGYTYDAMHIVKAAIEEAGSTDPDAFVEAMEATDHTGVAGRWVFDENHDPLFGPDYRVMGMTQWQEGGERAVVWPESIQTEEFQVLPWQE
ncbi:MAG: ABC transporter substrate-binding protein [Pseudomonadota bacterium]